MQCGQHLRLIQVLPGQNMDRLPEKSRVSDAIKMTQLSQDGRRSFKLQFKASHSRRCYCRKLFQIRGLTTDDQLRQVDVADIRTAFGFVHVMCRDKQRDPTPRQFEKQVPEIASRNGIDSGCRFVKKQDIGLVNQRAGECQPLLPSARKCRCQLIDSVTDSRQFLHGL